MATSLIWHNATNSRGCGNERDGARKRNHVFREAEAGERFLLKGKNVA